MGVLPLGTGNLLARNLDLPLDMQDALRVGLEGIDRPLDVGTFVAGGDEDQGRKFVVMAGIGFDAAMMADAPEGVKAKLGWPAYVVSGVKHLRDRGVVMQIRVDDQPPVRRTARAVIVGNVGKLQGGIVLFPEAVPDDGMLDVAVLAPRTLGDWARVMGRLVFRRHRDDARLQHLRGRRIEIRARSPLPVELDGDPLDEATGVVVEVEPGALLVRVTRDSSD
jgi:diacylglycerol kinase family enzyme